MTVSYPISYPISRALSYAPANAPLGKAGKPNPFLSLNLTGVGDSISQNTYESKLATVSGRSVNVLASGGMTSTQVAARFGAIPIIVNVTGAQIPASGAVALTACAPVPINLNSNAQSIPATLVGVPGTLTRTSGNSATNTYTFTRTTAGSIVSCPDGSTLGITDVKYDAINIFWAGFNGADGGFSPQSDTAAMVAKCTGPYLVLSILNQGGSQYNASGAFASNNAMLAAYGDWSTGGNYVDIRQYLVNHYNPTIAQDVTDFGNGTTTSCVPTSLRQDFIHPNQSGQYLTAELLNRVLIAKGWASDISPGLDVLFTPITLQATVASPGVLIGATPGSTITTNIPGVTVDSATRTFSGTPTSSGTISNAWVETLAGQSNSPKSSPQAISTALWTPLNISSASLINWWNPRNGSSIAGGLSASGWTDQIGGLAWVQATGAAQPTYSPTARNGTPGLLFNGTTQVMHNAATGFPLTSAARQIVVAGFSTAGAGNVAFVYGNPTAGAIVSITDGSPLNLYDGGTAHNATEAWVANDRTVILGLSGTSGTWDISGNAQETFTISGLNTAGSGLAVLGSWIAENVAFFDGALQDVMVISGTLSASELAKVAGFISWNTGRNGAELPIGSPYKSRAPLITDP